MVGGGRDHRAWLPEIPAFDAPMCPVYASGPGDATVGRQTAIILGWLEREIEREQQQYLRPITIMRARAAQGSGAGLSS